MAVTRAPGTVTVGIDKAGKHYKYETGGGRGRQGLDLPAASKKVLAKAGLRPGRNFAIPNALARKLGVFGAGGNRRVAGVKPVGKSQKTRKYLEGQRAQTRNTQTAIEAESAILHSHWKWLANTPIKGKSATKTRLDQLMDKGRDKWLSSGNSATHKVFAGVVLSTIFGTGFNGKTASKAKAASRYKVSFNPGTLDAGGGYITLKTPDGKSVVSRMLFNHVGDLTAHQIEHARNMFHGNLKTDQRLVTKRKEVGKKINATFAKAQKKIEDQKLPKGRKARADARKKIVGDKHAAKAAKKTEKTAAKETAKKLATEKKITSAQKGAEKREAKEQRIQKRNKNAVKNYRERKAMAERKKQREAVRAAKPVTPPRRTKGPQKPSHSGKL